MQQMIFIADLIACSTCFGRHYAHRQEPESIIQAVKIISNPETLCVIAKMLSERPHALDLYSPGYINFVKKY